MTIVIADGNGFVALGKQGENNATEVRFPVAEDWAALFGEGVFQLLILRPTEATPYAVPVTVDGANVCWAVSGTDVSIPGIGGCELRYTVGETLAKSETYVTLTEKAVGGTDGPYPTPWEEWVDQVMQAAADAEAAQVAAELAETHAEAAEDAAEIALGKAETAQEKAEDAQEGAETAQGHAEAAQDRAEIAQRAAEMAQGKAEEAEADAIVAKNAAQTAQRKAEDAQSAAETAQTAAETAQSKAETAQGKAEDAQTAAETAQGLAESARDAAQIAKTAAETAQSKAETAQGKAEDAQTAAETAQGKAEDAQTAAETAQTAAETAQGLAEAAQTAAETAAATFSTDTTLTVSGKAADAKAAGDDIANIENGVNANFINRSFNPAIKKGEYLKLADGSIGNSNAYCRTTNLNTVVNYTNGRRSAINFSTTVYECCIAYYDETGDTSGTGYINNSGYRQGYIYFPKNAVIFGISFRRVDRANITDADVTAIRAALEMYFFTDTALSTSGAAADAKTVGDRISTISEESPNIFYLTSGSQIKYGVTVTVNDDGSITFNGTATNAVSLWMLGDTNGSTTNIKANTTYVVQRELIDGTRSGNHPYFKYTDSEHSTSATASNNLPFTTANSPNIYLAISNGSSFTNARYQFSLTEGDTFYPIIQRGIRIAADPIARQKVNDYKPYQAGNIFFTVSVPRPMAFGSTISSAQNSDIECVLKLPTSYRPVGTPTRLVLCCHGSGGYIDSANNVWWHDSWNAFVNDLVSNGYAVFDCNIFPISEGTSICGEHYGSPLYIQNCYRAYRYIMINYNVYREIFVHGCSMGGVGATGFAHIYSDIVLAESSFAGRDAALYLRRWRDLWTASEKLEYAKAIGYDTVSDAEADHFSHISGYYPSLGLTKIEDGALIAPPDKETDFANWISYYADLETYTQSQTSPTWIGTRKRPYKAWNSWGDRDGDTKLETVLAKAYNIVGSCPYYSVIYDTYTHSQMCYGAQENMRDQLYQFYRQFV